MQNGSDIGIQGTFLFSFVILYIHLLVKLVFSK